MCCPSEQAASACFENLYVVEGVVCVVYITKDVTCSFVGSLRKREEAKLNAVHGCM